MKSLYQIANNLLKTYSNLIAILNKYNNYSQSDILKSYFEKLNLKIRNNLLSLRNEGHIKYSSNEITIDLIYIYKTCWNIYNSNQVYGSFEFESALNGMCYSMVELYEKLAEYLNQEQLYDILNIIEIFYKNLNIKNNTFLTEILSYYKDFLINNKNSKMKETLISTSSS